MKNFVYTKKVYFCSKFYDNKNEIKSHERSLRVKKDISDLVD